MVLGKLSGKNAVGSRLAELGFQVDKDGLERLFIKFKRLADSKKNITDDDLRSLVLSVLKTGGDQPRWKLQEINVFAVMHDPNPTQTTSSLTLTNPYTGEQTRIAHVAAGSVETIYAAIDKVVKLPLTLRDYNIASISSGTDAIGEVTVQVSPNDKHGKPLDQVYTGFGGDADILVASAKAYVNAINAATAGMKHLQEMTVDEPSVPI